MNTPSNHALVYLLHQEIDDMFLNWAASKPLRTGAPHASSILQPESEWCLRRQVLLALYPDEARMPVQKPWDVKQSMIFLHGWGLHEKYQKLFSQFGQVVEVETSHFDTQRFLHFTPDAITTFGGDTLLWEIKGYKQETYDKLDERKEPPQAAHLQCNFYLHLLGLKKGVVLVENKNTQAVKLWVIDHNKELAWTYTDRCEQVRGSVLRRKIPARVCSSCTEHKAEKCPVKELCFRAWD